MPRSSVRRGQVEPIPALLALLVVGAGLGLYVGTLERTLPASRSEPVAAHVADAVERRAGTDGIVVPAKLVRGLTTVPDGHECNLTLTVDGRRWSAGPSASGGQTTDRVVGVRVAPGRVSTGRLRVRVWS